MTLSLEGFRLPLTPFALELDANTLSEIDRAIADTGAGDDSPPPIGF